jgi:hypothetical protein
MSANIDGAGHEQRERWLQLVLQRGSPIHRPFLGTTVSFIGDFFTEVTDFQHTMSFVKKEYKFAMCYAVST